MTADSFELRALRQIKRKNYLFCAVLFLAGVSLHWLQLGVFIPKLALLNVAWSASFVVIGLAVGAGWIPTRWSGVIGATLSLVAVTTYLHLTGGPSGLYFPMLCALPLLVALYNPYDRVPAVMACLATVAAVTVLDALAGMPLRQTLMQVWGFALVGILAIHGTRTYRRLWDAEKSAQTERLAVVEQLAESERRRLRAERERAEVERLVLVGQLAAGVAHEVNNPLAFVKSNLSFLEQELLREGGPEDREELRDVLAETKQGVMRIQQIVLDLRSFSRETDAGGDEGLPESAAQEARRLASVRLHSLGEVALEIPPGLPPVRLGQRYLVQVLVNLLLNAADAVEAAQPPRRARILVRGRQEDEKVRLEVEDNGPGIPPEVMARLFEPFFTTKPPGKGTGLGLALSQEYVARVGGSLRAENRPEGGARFIVVLPLAPGLAAAA